MSGRYAWTRPFGDEISRCELTHLARAPIDLRRAQSQHADYERALRAAGCTLGGLPRLEARPDAVFVEDTAIVLDESVVLTRPGAASRRGEVESVEAALRAHRPIVRLPAPARLDGGDVLRMGRRLFVGRSARTDAAGIEALTVAVSPWDYEVVAVEISGCLHLKTAVTCIADGILLLNPGWVDPASFGQARALAVDATEPFAANVLRLGAQLLVSAAAPRTQRRLEAEGFRCETVDVSELAKAEAGLTCCSLVMEPPVR